MFTSTDTVFSSLHSALLMKSKSSSERKNLERLKLNLVSLWTVYWSNKYIGTLFRSTEKCTCTAMPCKVVFCRRCFSIKNLLINSDLVSIAGNPNWEFLQMILDYKDQIEFSPLQVSIKAHTETGRRRYWNGQNRWECETLSIAFAGFLSRK